MASRPTRRKVTERWGGFRRCESMKVSFATKDEAWTAAERMMELGRVRPGCHLTPYQCRRCGEFHIANRVIVRVSE